MTPRQVALVQASWKDVLAVSETAAQLFYLRLFALDPSLEPRFKGDMRDRGRKLIASISAGVNGLARTETPVLVDDHHATVAEALLWTLEQGLGARFTPEVKEAWMAAYGLLAVIAQPPLSNEGGIYPCNAFSLQS